jgi:hypothetical protein
MAEVSLYLADFSGRLTRLLDSIEATSIGNECNLTQLVAVASHGIGVPWERLTATPQASEPCPGMREAMEKFKALKRQPFLKCELWAAAPASWRRRTHHRRDLQHYSDRPMYGWRCRQVVYHLRNALRRGTLAVVEAEDGVDLIFFDRVYSSALVVSVADFRRFLRRWFKFVEALSL